VIQFDEELHEYRVDSRVLPSVTNIISDLKLSPPYPEDRGALGFGKAVHKAAELYIADRLDKANTNPVILQYLTGLEEKTTEMRLRPIGQELRVWHKYLGYAGTLDYFGYVYDGDLAIIDYKSGQPPPCVELQTAGYELALRSMNFVPIEPGTKLRRFSMQLLPDRAIVKEHKNRELDHAAWTGAVNLYYWKQLRKM
jgi:hypothetical protein